MDQFKIDFEQRRIINKLVISALSVSFIFSIMSLLILERDQHRFIIGQPIAMSIFFFILTFGLYLSTDRAFSYFLLITIAWVMLWANLLLQSFLIIRIQTLSLAFLGVMLVLTTYFYFRERRRAIISRELNISSGKTNIRKGEIDIRGSYLQSLRSNEDSRLGCRDLLTILLLPIIANIAFSAIFAVFDTYTRSGFFNFMGFLRLIMATGMCIIMASFMAVAVDVYLLERECDKRFILATNKRYMPVTTNNDFS